jgi:hypothetical protein
MMAMPTISDRTFLVLLVFLSACLGGILVAMGYEGLFWMRYYP